MRSNEFSVDFEAFPKIARLSREVIVTEKIDGTNAQICVSDDGIEVRAGSQLFKKTIEKDDEPKTKRGE